jgi:hypothetical protein
MERDGPLLPASPELQAQLAALGRAEGEEVAAAFRALALGQPGEAGEHAEVLATILHSVAFYPLKPAVMQAELVRLGLRAAVAASLASVWAEVARPVVAARRRPASDLLAVETEVRQALHPHQGAEAAVVTLRLEGARRPLVLRLRPDKLLELYEQLEQVQAAIDGVCQ